QRMTDSMYRSADRRTYGLVRASNAGAAALPYVLYNDYYDHRDFITALVSSSFIGVLWTPEVRRSESGEEWLRRMQSVCFSPLAMLNAWADGTKPWSFPEVADAVREVMKLRADDAIPLFRFRRLPLRGNSTLPGNGPGRWLRRDRAGAAGAPRLRGQSLCG